MARIGRADRKIHYKLIGEEMKDLNELQMVADQIEEFGFADTAKVLRSPFGELVGKRISVYGPNYIWRGKLVGVNELTITLEDCYQVFETGDHATADSEGERIGDRHHITIATICNFGECAWS